MHTTIGYVRFGSSQRSSLPRSLSLILGSRRGSCRVLESAEVISYNLLKFFMKMAPRVGIEPTTHGLTVRCSTAELPGNTSLAEGRGFSGNGAGIVKEPGAAPGLTRFVTPFLPEWHETRASGP